MSVADRKLLPENLRYLFLSVRCNGKNYCSYPKLLKSLVNDFEYYNDDAEQIIIDSIEDGFLKVAPTLPGTPAGGTTTRTPKKGYENKILEIPDENEIEIDDSTPDWYCFECKSPGGLHKCLRCARSFHKECQRKNPECPNEEPLSVAKQPKDVVAFHFLTTGGKNVISTADRIVPADSDLPTDYETEEEEATLDRKCNIEEETKEVICIGEIRPPKRNQTHVVQYKNETAGEGEDAENELDLCSACRLKKKATFKDPPNMTPEDICNLLRYSFDRIKSWISADTFSLTRESENVAMPKQDMNLFIKMCLKNPVTMEDIRNKIDGNVYNNLTDFYVDILNVQHNMGILFGTTCEDYGLTRYLVFDAFYDTCEISQCAQCFHNSNVQEDGWFTNPCIPRHELVFAKQKGYGYWPAKIIQVKSDLHDVRFFGKKHTRAIVPAHFIKPIDSDYKALQIKKTLAFEFAMSELSDHQGKLALQPTYGSEAVEMRNEVVVSTAIAPQEMSDLVVVDLVTNKRGRPKSKANNNNSRSADPSPASNSSRRSKRQRISPAVDQIPETNSAQIGPEKTPRPRIKANLTRDIVETMKRQMEEAKTIEEIKNIAVETLLAETRRSKAREDELKEQLSAAKKAPWCFWCQETAIYHCCFNSSYCSLECQQAHWNKEHKNACKRNKRFCGMDEKGKPSKDRA